VIHNEMTADVDPRMQSLVDRGSSPDGSEVAIRPSPARFRRVLGATVLAMALTAISAAAWAVRSSVNGEATTPIIVAMFVGLVAFFVAYLSLYLRNFSVFAGQGYFGKTDALGRRHVWSRDILDRAVLRTVNFGQGANPRYMLLSADGAPLILFSARMFEPVTTDALFRKLSIDVNERSEVLGPAELRREFPKAIPWWATHPRRLGILVVGSFVVVLAAIVILAVLNYRPAPSQ
jgi:hypothetical protein